MNLLTATSPAEGLALTTTLNDGREMPWLGLGVWQIESDAETERVVCSAVELGYRSIDTATIYGNERGVGQAIRACGVPREQLYITTKLWNDDIRAERMEAAFDRSLKKLGLDYVDLYLVHWPIKGRIVAAWKTMEKLLATGRTKSIGVSNHLPEHLDELMTAADVVPAINQIEFHPYLQSPVLLQRCHDLKIQVEAWSPLMQGGELLSNATLRGIAERHGKSVVQVVLRWDLQRGVVTIPKTVTRARMAENADLFDFTLSPEEMAAIASLDQNRRVGPDPAHFGF